MSERKKRLCLDLLNSESEDEVIRHLKAAGYWDDPSVWRFYGDRKNNWSIIGAQQASPVAALCEKLVNSIDAVLMRECQLRGIPMQTADAPQSVSDALDRFFGIKRGNLANIGATKRAELSRHIGLVATGAKPNSKYAYPNLTVFDNGEGQTPHTLPSTILSLSENNKASISFVQGKFNTGGSGVVRHGNNYRLQVIISRRCPRIANRSDSSASLWGFTVVRRDKPPEGMKQPMVTYLAPGKEILSFDCDALTVPHNPTNHERAPRLEWGTIIKLLEYKVKRSQRTTIKRDLYYAVSAKLPKPGLPVRFYEFRDYRQKNPESTMAGLLVRLADEKRDILEKGFPLFKDVRIDGEPLKVEVYALTDAIYDDKKYRSTDGVIYVLNGQVHGAEPKRFFQRKNVNKSYLKDALLVVVDASELSRDTSADLFMNNRERLSDTEFADKLVERLEKVIREDSTLKSLQDRRRSEALMNRLGDSRPVRDVINQVLKSSTSLFDVLALGKELTNPYASVTARVREEPFVGKIYPEFFRLNDRHRGRNERPINRSVIRFLFQTDAENDYLQRDISPGRFSVTCNGRLVQNRDFYLSNGTATLDIALPDDATVGQRLRYFVEVTDETRIEPFVEEFTVVLTPEVSNSSGGSNNAKDPAQKGKGDQALPAGLEIPEPNPVYRNDWEKHKFDDKSALRVVWHEGTFDYFVNMDNVYLNHELKQKTPSESAEGIKQQFKSAMVLLGLMIIHDSHKRSKTDSENEHDPVETVSMITSALAPIILPMINSLGSIKIDD